MAPSERTPALAVSDLNVWFELDDGSEVHAVKGVSFSVEAGERLGLVGDSGCGKTSTILALMGLLPPNAWVSGEISVGGTRIVTTGEDATQPMRWSKISMVFQGAMNSFNPVLRVADQIAEPMIVHDGISRRDGRRRAGELLEMVGINSERGRDYPHQFSGGMKQRAAIAMAIACEPQVLLADEPTTALDVIVQAELIDLLVDLSSRLDLALVMVTHDLPLVGEICQRAAVMYAGEIVECGAVSNLALDAAHPYTRRLFAATPRLPGEETPPGAKETLDEGPSPVEESEGVPTTSPVLSVRDLEVQFQGRRGIAGVLLRRPPPVVRAVDGISFAVEAGEMLALVGESGSGKTTAAQAIIRMAQAQSGEITVAGCDVFRASGKRMRKLRRDVQLIYQDPYEALDPRFTVRQAVEESLLIHAKGKTRLERREAATAALVQAGLTPPEIYLDRYPHQLSGGQRQRVAIAAGLVLQPKLLIADEPVSMLDVSVRGEVLGLLGKIRREAGIGILMITHDLSTAAEHADRIAVLYRGRIVEVGPARDVVTRPRHPYTRALIAAVPRIDGGSRDSDGLRSSPAAATGTALPTGGCRFSPRCADAWERCKHDDPVELLAAPSGHGAACWLPVHGADAATQGPPATRARYTVDR